VLASGRGSNLQALLDAGREGALGPAEVRVVVSNVPGAGALARAEAAGVPAVLVDHRPFAGDRAAFERALVDVLAEHRVELGGLGGLLGLLGPPFTPPC